MTVPSTTVRATIAVVLMVLSVVWLWDATVHGAKGFVSTYVAPVIVIGNLLGAYWAVRENVANFANGKRNQVNANLKAMLFWLAVVIAAVVVYQYANAQRAPDHATTPELDTAR